MRRLAAVAAIALVVPAHAFASDATSAEVRSLAGRAGDDPAALAELRLIDRVDGTRVDLRRALQGSPGPALDARLRTLSRGDAARGTSPRPARAEARSILSQPRYRGSSVPRPLHGVLQWLARKLAFVGDTIDALGELVPGGTATVWAVLGALVVALAAFFTTRLARRRAQGQVAAADGRRDAAGAEPAELERAAAEAERRGDLERGIRLRFRAGLLRLARKRAIPQRDSVTTREVRRTLRLPEFDALAATFDEIVYGGRAPVQHDVESARSGWPRVVEKAAAR